MLLEQSSLQYHICCTVCVATAGGSESYKIHHWAQTSKVPSKLTKERWARTISCVKSCTFLTRENSCSDAEDTAEKSFTTQACKLLNFNFKIRLHLFTLVRGQHSNAVLFKCLGKNVMYLWNPVPDGKRGFFERNNIF